MSKSWAVPGTEVIERFSSIHGVRYGAVRKIGKVYKNGNFLLENSADQWRPHNDSAWRAGNGHSSHVLVPLTEETRQEVERNSRVKMAQRLVFEESKRLEKLARTEWDDLLVEADRIIARDGKAAASAGHE